MLKIWFLKAAAQNKILKFILVLSDMFNYEIHRKSFADDMKEKLTKKQIKKMNKRFSSNFKKYKDK